MPDDVHCLSVLVHPYFYFLKDFIYLFLERGKEGERGEKHQCAVASWAPPNGDLARNPGMCPDWESNWQPFDSQAGTQSTEPHQPGQNFFFLFSIKFYLLMRGIERERGREREICCSIYLRIHWLILVCAMLGDQTCNLGVWGWCSSQLSSLARAAG